MPDGDGELWAFVIEALPDKVPAAARVRRLLKIAGRSLRLKCVHLSEEGEIARLQRLIDGLTARVAQQSELLAKAAERRDTA